MTKKKIIKFVAISTYLWASISLAAFGSETRSLKKELNKIKNSYEKRISDLESKLNKNNSTLSSKYSRNIYGNKFNPSIGIILNGKYSTFSKKTSEFSGFAVGEEGGREKEGFAIGESEINFSSNIDDKFYGNLTAAIVNEEGSDKIELEEAYIRTSPALGLPAGFEIKAGRAFWNLGYLNSHHAHSDDFSDRPLPYRAFLNKSFNDDGVQFSYILPIDFYLEIGGGSFRGDDFPFGEGDGTGSYSVYSKLGGDIGNKQNWQFGLSTLSGEAKNGRKTEEDDVIFSGNTDLYIADFRYTFAPTGNSRNKELILQGEYFYREEGGLYNKAEYSNGDSSGLYAQAVYKFSLQWRAGLRYSKLFAAQSSSDTKYNPKSYSTMIDWTNSEFSRVRLQYSHEELSKNHHDNQIALQYVMSFGAHCAHKY